MERTKAKKTKTVVVILGPTSSGKTSLSLGMCLKNGGEIISADSRQIYKYMDVGTGKLPMEGFETRKKDSQSWTINGVKIWGYDLALPNQYFSAFDYASLALEKIKYLTDNNIPVLVVGGTGFYIDILTGRIKPSYIKPHHEYRTHLAGKTLVELQTELKNRDSGAYQLIDINNKVRLIRALEKIEFASYKEGQKLNYLENIKFKYLGLTGERTVLYKRVDSWLEFIWKHGLLEETEGLLRMGFGESPQLKGLIYKSAVSFLNKTCPSEQAKQQAKHDLHAYIRRQQTYFKKIPTIRWFDPAEDNYIQKMYNVIDG